MQHAALEYALQKRGARLLGGTTCGRTAKEIGAEMASVLDRRRNGPSALKTYNASVAPGEVLSDATWVRVSHRLMRHMGHGRCPYATVLHTNTRCPHIHVVTTTVDVDGRLVRDGHNWIRVQLIARTLEAELGLRSPRSSWETPTSELPWAEVHRLRRGEPAFADQVASAVAQALARARSWVTLERDLEAQGLALTRRRSGLIVTDGRAAIALCDVPVEPKLSMPRLNTLFNEAFDAARSQATGKHLPDLRGRSLSRDESTPAPVGPRENWTPYDLATIEQSLARLRTETADSGAASSERFRAWIGCTPTDTAA
jgi:hypothetical protein